MNVRFYLSYDKYFEISFLGVITLYFCHYVRNIVIDVITFPENR